MKNGWQTKRIGEIATIKPPKSEARDRVAGDALVSFLPMEDLGIAIKYPEPKQTKRFSDAVGSYTYFAEGDVLLAKITPCFENGKLGIAKGLKKGIGFGSSEFIVIRPNSTVSNEWLFHLLSRDNFRNEGAQRMGGAVGQQRVPKEFVESYEIPVPPLPEQQRIVGILDEAFEGLARATANAEQNLRNARALFEGHLQSVFTQPRKGWEEKSVGDLVADRLLAPPIDGNHGEIHPKKADFVSSGVPFIMASDLEDGRVNQRDCAFISRKQADSLRKGFAEDGDVLLSHKGTIGRVAILHTKHDYVMLTPQVTYYRVIAREKFLNRFLYYSLQSPNFVQRMNEIAGAGSTRAYIGILKQLELPIAFPVLAEQERLANQLDALAADTQRLESIYRQKLAALNELKKSLLHEAFSGRL
jgi:type I restriction enzyme S subunit